MTDVFSAYNFSCIWNICVISLFLPHVEKECVHLCVMQNARSMQLGVSNPSPFIVHVIAFFEVTYCGNFLDYCICLQSV